MSNPTDGQLLVGFENPVNFSAMRGDTQEMLEINMRLVAHWLASGDMDGDKELRLREDLTKAVDLLTKYRCAVNEMVNMAATIEADSELSEQTRKLAAFFKRVWSKIREERDF